jgi:hypothetical protein
VDADGKSALEDSVDEKSPDALNQGISGPWLDLLDRCRKGDVIGAVYETADALLCQRRKLNEPLAWRASLDQPGFRALRDLLREDPFSDRAATKPRGYPGDAVLLDLAYRVERPAAATTPLGRLAFEATTNSPGCRSIRARKRAAAEFIDSVAMQFNKPRLACIACGHLRELAICEAFHDGDIGEFTAVDQDPEAIARLHEIYRPDDIRTQCASLKEFLHFKPTERSRFHGIYALSLFDYLDDKSAAKTLATLFRMLHPWGRLLVANLAPSLKDIAYLEAVMDWWMVYRSPEHLTRIAKNTVGENAAVIRAHTDILGNVSYLELERRG